MAAFDRCKAERDAWERLVARPDEEDAELSWYRDVLAAKDIEVLESWCTRRRIKVDFVRHRDALYDEKLRTILVNFGSRPRRQVALILHECGHHLIEQSRRRSSRLASPGRSGRRIDRLEDEMEAWRRGWRLSERLGLRTSRIVFDEVRVDCLRTYVRWVADPKEWGEDE